MKKSKKQVEIEIKIKKLKEKALEAQRILEEKE